MSKIAVKDIVATSTESFSHAMKVCVENAKKTYGRLESIEVAPPWSVVLNDEGEVEFRTTVRILYRDET